MIIIIDGTESKSIKIMVYKDKRLILSRYRKNIDVYKYLDDFFKKINITDVLCIGINIGPGSFSSTRASVAYISGLSLGSMVPVIGVSGFDILSKDKKKLILNAGRGKVYIQSNGGFLVKKSDIYEKIDNNVFFDIIYKKFKKNEFSDPLSLLPLYITEI